MPNQPRIIRLHRKTEQKLLSLKREAEQEGEYRVAKRIHAVLLSNQEKSSIEISKIIHSSRSKVSEWLKNYELYGYEALLEGQRSGRPSLLSADQRSFLGDIIDNGPVTYGFRSAVWSSLMIAQVIRNEFSVDYHPGHVRKLLKNMNYSMQKPKRVLVKANDAQRNRWRRYIYPNIKKKPVI
jgi:transposase